MTTPEMTTIMHGGLDSIDGYFSMPIYLLKDYDRSFRYNKDKIR